VKSASLNMLNCPAAAAAAAFFSAFASFLRRFFSSSIETAVSSISLRRVPTRLLPTRM